MSGAFKASNLGPVTAEVAAGDVWIGASTADARYHFWAKGLDAGAPKTVFKTPIGAGASLRVRQLDGGKGEGRLVFEQLCRDAKALIEQAWVKHREHEAELERERARRAAARKVSESGEELLAVLKDLCDSIQFVPLGVGPLKRLAAARTLISKLEGVAL